MPDLAFVRPNPERPGLLVRMPERNMAPLPPEGRAVPLTEYWVRRINDGAVVLADDPGAQPTLPAPAEPAPKPRAKKEA
ncbi:MAG: DUF2635 domain-containing protein [Hyphomicrobiales bacterium]|nr:DUF2635 domain-containing protein [Hyphomicrobiales bacterium]